MMKISRNGVLFDVADEHPFWSSMQDGSWEPETIALLDRLNGPGRRFVDIGAWMGPTTLYAAAKGSECWSFEPDHVAYEKLSANVGANEALRDRVHLQNKAVTPDGAPIQLFTRYTFGDSGSSILSRVKDRGASVEVASTTFDRFLSESRIDRIDLIKMDIEGGEFFVMPTMRTALERMRPVLCVATHYPYLIEYFEKRVTPSGAVRRVKRAVSSALKRDPWARAKAAARVHFDAFAEALSSYPHIFTLRMERVTRDRLFEVMQEPIELVFAHDDLAGGRRV